MSHSYPLQSILFPPESFQKHQLKIENISLQLTNLILALDDTGRIRLLQFLSVPTQLHVGLNPPTLANLETTLRSWTGCGGVGWVPGPDACFVLFMDSSLCVLRPVCIVSLVLSLPVLCSKDGSGLLIFSILSSFYSFVPSFSNTLASLTWTLVFIASIATVLYWCLESISPGPGHHCLISINLEASPRDDGRGRAAVCSW